MWVRANRGLRTVSWKGIGRATGLDRKKRIERKTAKEKGTGEIDRRRPPIEKWRGGESGKRNERTPMNTFWSEERGP